MNPGRAAAARTLRRAAVSGLRAVATLVLALAATFLLLEALPGDPLDRLDDPALTAEQVQRTRTALALDRPAPQRLAAALGALATGDAGTSFTLHRPVSDVLREALPATIVLGGATLVLAYGLGLGAGFALLLAPARWRRRASAPAAALAALPRFWLGVALVVVFHDALGWLPASHAAPAGEAAAGFAVRVRHLVLPALALALPAAAGILRLQLAVAAAAWSGPRVTVARALGLSAPRVAWRSVARPHLAPLIAQAGVDLPVLVSGAVVVETVFAWPGLGRLSAQAVLAADIPLALGCVALATVTTVGGGWLAEWAAGALDRRRDADSDAHAVTEAGASAGIA